MKLEILEEAGEELHEAIAYYEELERGLRGCKVISDLIA